jgi:integrase
MSQQLQKIEGQPNLFLDTNSGIYQVRVQIRGRDKWRSTGSTTLKMAIRRAREILGQLETTRGDEKTIPTLSEWWTTYRAAKAKQKSKATWKREDITMTKHVLPHFGNVCLNDLTKSQLERYLNFRRHKAAEGTVTREHSLLHTVFEAAIDEGLLQLNPLRGVKRVAYAVNERVLTGAEQTRVAEALSPQMSRWFLFILGTGIRVGEVTGIRPSCDINWEAREFFVTGKGGKSRWVPLVPASAEGLLSLLRDQQAYRAPEDTLWPQHPDDLRQRLQNVCKRVDVKLFGPHCLRHTFATRYLAGGGDIYILSQILGHAKVSTTERHYAHLRPRDLAARSAGVDIGVAYGS